MDRQLEDDASMVVLKVPDEVMLPSVGRSPPWPDKLRGRCDGEAGWLGE